MQMLLILKFGRQNVSEGVLVFFKPLVGEMESMKTAIFLYTEESLVTLLLNKYNLPFNM